MNLKEIKQTLDSDTGKALKEYLISELESLDSIKVIKEKDTPTHQAIELKAQLRAYEKLKDILDEIATIESSETERPERDRYDA